MSRQSHRHPFIPPNCFKCDKELLNVSIVAEYDSGLGVTEREDINQPSDAATFISTGHYGCSVFDPADDTCWLEINICDECLTDHKNRVLFGIRLPQGFTKPVQYEMWNPFKHN